VRFNGTVLQRASHDCDWRDSQIMFPQPQNASGSLRHRVADPAQHLLRISCPLDSALLRPGLNRIGLAVLRQAPHMLRQFRVERVELELRP